MQAFFSTSKDLSGISGTVVIIPAAGVGSRMQSEVPKQYLTIKNQTILELTVNKFLSFEPIELIVLVVAADDPFFQDRFSLDDEKILVIGGGEERVNSVSNGLQFLFENGLPAATPIMVHDAARPCITHEDLAKLSRSYAGQNRPCMLASPVVDTLQRVDSNNQVLVAVDRNQLVRAFTPQMACFADLRNAIESSVERKELITDEVSALTGSGYLVDVVIGRSDNIKITQPEDLALAGFYLEKQAGESNQD